MSEVDVLIAARKQLTDKGWTQGAFARDIEGKVVHSSSSLATSFCLSGAVRSVCDGFDHDVVREILLKSMPPGVTVVSLFNDSASSIDEVLDLVDKAIVLAKEWGQV